MRLAFAITSLFPGGGLQRDCLAIAGILSRAGHNVSIVTADYRQPVELGGLPLHVWAGGSSALGRRRFVKRLAAAAGDYDRIVGFGKLPGLDVYYCADPPLEETKSALAQLVSPRLRTQKAFEREIFGPDGRTSVLVASSRQIESYQRAWSTPPTRFRVVPPTLNRARRRPELRLSARSSIRADLALPDTTLVLLAVASAPRTKGTDRIVEAMARFPDAVLLVAGVNPDSREGRWVTGHASRFGVLDRLRLLGYREDIPELMAAADLFVHPARRETTGTVILESLANGLPLIVTELCGYASHVVRAAAGRVLPTPFQRQDLVDALVAASDPAQGERWSANAAAYGADPALDGGLMMAAEAMVGPLWG